MDRLEYIYEKVRKEKNKQYDEPTYLEYHTEFDIHSPIEKSNISTKAGRAKINDK